ncbi:MAG: rRNA maturation RNase YbeY [Candidatus Acidiferrales bacterium]
MVLNRQKSVRVPVAPLERFLGAVLRHFRLPADSVTVCFARDADVARWNRTYRGKQGATDVLSFPAASNGAGSRIVRQLQARRRGMRNSAPGEYLGDIAISPSVARKNAERFKRSLSLELRILILHGVLHLLGYDHESDRGEMERYELQLRSRFRLT